MHNAYVYSRLLTDMFLPSAPNTCRSTTARPRRYSKTSYSTCSVASGLLQRRAGRSSSFHPGTVPASPARSGTHRYGSQAAWPYGDSSSSRVALVASRWEDPVQAVLAGSQVASWTHAGIYLRPSNIGCQYSRSIMRASSCGNLVVPRTRRRIVDRAFSVAAPRAWNRLPTDLFRRDLKTVLFHSVYGHQDTDWLYVMRPRSSSRGRNTSASLTVTVTVKF